MSRFKLSIFLSVFAVLGFLSANGQAARSPFSSLGYGDYFGESLVNNQGMAGTGVSNPQVWFFNNQNPALVVNNRFTVFQAGIIGENKRLYSDTVKGKSQNGNLNYLVLGFPAWRNKTTGEVQWATGIGLMPYSSVNYNFQYSDSIAGAKVLYHERAIGGFNQLYWSNGFRITKNLNVGLKTALLFSSIISDYSNLLVLNDPNQVQYVPTVHEIRTVKGLRFTPGVSYKIDSINQKYVFNFGATYELKSNLPSSLSQVFERRDYSGNILQSDTIDTKSSKIEFPNRITAGISFGRTDKWMLATDYTYTSFGGTTTSLGLDRVAVQNGWRFAVGGELTPDVRSLSSYLKRVTYRAGFSSEKGTYLVNGHDVKDFGINFGFSFPVSRISSLDVAFRSGKRGDFKLNGIEENYFKIYFGVTFNDQWFIKRKFD